ncbi:hypothetical protein C0J52_13790 [Blattella germanica]|nr:hypothetical protein C0J52_13790 [Blattella germanica]
MAVNQSQLAPIKALCSERYLDWSAKFSCLGLRCLEITGDTDDFQLANLSSYHLLMTTPEKWDSLTRKWKDNIGMVQKVKLFLIDEVHLLNEEKRGPALEVVVSRMKTIQEVITANNKQNQEHYSMSEEDQTNFRIRFIAVSATIPNIEDLAQWLGTSHDKPARYFKISEDMRPVKLTKIVLGYSHPLSVSQFRFEMSLSYKLRDLIFKHSGGKPTLIFCSTRKENLFREGELPVLVTTSTLAMGVNLPAHLVIIKGTQQYLNGSYKDYSETQILQMIGRAGRPQFDTSAVAVIMTQDGHSLEDVLHLIASCPEFSGIQLRVSEKKNLNLLNKSPDRKCIRFPLRTKVSTSAMKVNCLIQASFDCLTIYDHSLKQDMYQIMWIGQRVSNALVQYLQCKPHYRALLNAVMLSKCFRCKLWENSPYVSKQLKGIGVVLSTMLVASNKTSFQSIMESNPRDLESIINRPFPMGDNLIEAVSHLPQLELNLDTVINHSSVLVEINVSVSNYELVMQQNTAGPNHWLFLLVGDSNNKCLYKEKFKDDRVLQQDTTSWTVEIKDSSSITEVFVDLVSEQWVGLDVHSKITLKLPGQSPLKAKNTHEKISQKNRANAKRKNCQTSSVDSTQKRPSIVEQIREMSLKRLGMTPRTALREFVFTPKNSSILKPSTKKNSSEEMTNAMDKSKDESVKKNVQNEVIEVSSSYPQQKNKNSIKNYFSAGATVTKESAPNPHCRNKGTPMSRCTKDINSYPYYDNSESITIKDNSMNSRQEFMFAPENNVKNYKEQLQNFKYRRSSNMNRSQIKANIHQSYNMNSLENNVTDTGELHNLKDHGNDEISLPTSMNHHVAIYIPTSQGQESTFTQVESYTGDNQESVQHNTKITEKSFLSDAYRNKLTDSNNFTSNPIDRLDSNCTNIPIKKAKNTLGNDTCMKDLQYERSKMSKEYESIESAVETSDNSVSNENINRASDANNKNEIIPVILNSPLDSSCISNAVSTKHTVPTTSQCSGYSVNSDKYLNDHDLYGSYYNTQETENDVLQPPLDVMSELIVERDKNEQDGFFDFSSILPAMLHQSASTLKEDDYQTMNLDASQYSLEKDTNQIQNSFVTEVMHQAENLEIMNSESVDGTGNQEISETFNTNTDGDCDFQSTRVEDKIKNVNDDICTDELPMPNSNTPNKLLPLTTDTQIVSNSETNIEMDTSNEKPSIFSRSLPSRYYPIFNKTPQYSDSDTSNLSQSTHHNVTYNTEAVKELGNSSGPFNPITANELMEIQAVDNYFKQRSANQNTTLPKSSIERNEAENKQDATHKVHFNTTVNRNFNDENRDVGNTIQPRTDEKTVVSEFRQEDVKKINFSERKCSIQYVQQTSETNNIIEGTAPLKLLKSSTEVSEETIALEEKKVNETKLVQPKTSIMPKSLESTRHQQRIEVTHKQCYKQKYDSNIRGINSNAINKRPINLPNAMNTVNTSELNSESHKVTRKSSYTTPNEKSKLKVENSALDKRAGSLKSVVNSKSLPNSLANIPKKARKMSNIPGLPILNFKLLDDLDTFLANIPELKDETKFKNRQTCKTKADFRHKLRSSPPYKKICLGENFTTHEPMKNNGIDKELSYSQLQSEIDLESRDGEENMGLREERTHQSQMSSNNFYGVLQPLNPTLPYKNQNHPVSCTNKYGHFNYNEDKDTCNMKKTNEDELLSYDELNSDNSQEVLGVTPLNSSAQDGKKSFKKISDMWNFSQTHFTFQNDSTDANATLFNFQDTSKCEKQQYKEIYDDENICITQNKFSISPSRFVTSLTPPNSVVYNSPDISPLQFSPDLPRSSTRPESIDDLDVSSSPDVSRYGIQPNRNINDSPDISNSELVPFNIRNETVASNLDNIHSQVRYQEMFGNRKDFISNVPGHLNEANRIQSRNRSDAQPNGQTQLVLRSLRSTIHDLTDNDIVQPQTFQRSDNENRLLQSIFNDNVKYKLPQYQGYCSQNIPNNYKVQRTNIQFPESGNNSQQFLHNYYQEKKPVFRKTMQRAVSPKYESHWKKFEMPQANPQDKFPLYYSSGLSDEIQSGVRINVNINPRTDTLNFLMKDTQNIYANSNRQCLESASTLVSEQPVSSSVQYHTKQQGRI